MSASMTAFFGNVYREDSPKIIIVEPEKADCIFRSAKCGEIKVVTGQMDTIMAGLSCGEPSSIGWPILRDYAAAYISCGDDYTADGMRILGAPLPGDTRVISGESGAVGIGVLAALMTSEELEIYKKQLDLNENSRILFFSTEGATDPENYWKVVWNRKDF